MKLFIVRLFNLFFNLLQTLLAIPLAIFFIVIGRLAIIFSTYAEVSLLISRIPFLLGQKVRYYYYKATLKRVGRNVVFKYGSFCQYSTACIGNRVHIGYYNALGEVNMGDDIMVGGFVNFISGKTQHSYEDQSKTIREQKSKGRSMITIGSDVWIGSNSIIAASIGNRCVIGAGSVLMQEAEDHSIYAGNPARLIKKISAVYVKKS